MISASLIQKIYEVEDAQIIENHQLVTHSITNIGQWRNAKQLPNAEKKSCSKPLKIALLTGKSMIEVRAWEIETGDSVPNSMAVSAAKRPKILEL